MTKLGLFADHRVGEYWIVDPAEACVLQHVRAEGGGVAPARRHEGRQAVTSPLLPGLKLRLRDVFRGDFE